MGDDEPDGQALPPAAPAYDFRTGRPLSGPDDPGSPPWRPDGDDDLGIWAPDPEPRREPAPGPGQQTGPQQQPTYQQQPGYQQGTYQQPGSYHPTGPQQQPAYQQLGSQQPAYQHPGTYPGAYGPGGPTAEHAPLPPRRSNRAPVVVLLVGAVLAVGAIAAVLFLTRGRTTPGTPTAASVPASSAAPTTSTAAPSRSAAADGSSARDEFAHNVDAILQDSSDGRRRVIAAVNGVRNNCDVTPADAEASLTDVIANRQSVLTRAGDLAAPDASTEAAKADLVQALSASLEAGQGYQRWLESALASSPDASPPGCPDRNVPTDGNYDAASAASTRATSAKQAFVTAYNPIATQAGLTTWTSDQF